MLLKLYTTFSRLVSCRNCDKHCTPQYVKMKKHGPCYSLYVECNVCILKFGPKILLTIFCFLVYVEVRIRVQPTEVSEIVRETIVKPNVYVSPLLEERELNQMLEAEVHTSKSGVWGTPFAIREAKRAIPMRTVKVYSPALNLTAKFAVVENNQYVGEKFLAGAWWEEETIVKIFDYYNKLFKHSNKCNMVDVGANMGAWTVAMGLKALQLGPKCQVYAFEAQAAMYLNNVANVGLNGLPNVNVWLAAAVHRDGETVTMSDFGMEQNVPMGKIKYGVYDVKTNYGGRSLGTGDDERPIPGIRIDSLVLANVGIVKMDIEGAEQFALWGMCELIERNMPLMVIEWNSKTVNNVSIHSIAKAFREVPTQEQLIFDWKTWLQNLGYTLEIVGDDVFCIPPHPPV
jgi:FkbM family methyltransferase